MNSKFLSLYNIIMESTQESIKQIEALLANPEQFHQNPKLLSRIKKYLQILNKEEVESENLFDDLLNKFNVELHFPKFFAKELTREIEDKFDLSTMKSLNNYLNNRTIDIDSLCDRQQHTFTELFSKAGLDTSEEFIQYLSFKTFPTSPAMGPYEILFTILLKNAVNGNGKGDIRIGNALVEVKKTGGRLGGQKALGDASRCAEYIKSQFNMNGKNYKDYPNIDFSFTKERLKNDTNAFFKLCNANSNIMGLDDTWKSNGFINKGAKSILTDAWRQLFTNNSAWEEAFAFSNFIEPYLSFKNGKFNINDLNGFYNALLCFSLKYYQVIEKFSYFIVAGTSNFIILNENQLNDKDIISSNIILKTPPSFGGGERERKPQIALI